MGRTKACPAGRKRTGEGAAVTKVLLYHLEEDSERGARVRAVLDELGFRAVTVPEARLAETAEQLLAHPDGPCATPFEGKAPETEFLLFCGNEKQLDRLLKALRRRELAIPHKAMLTDSNRKWELCKLIEEVRREHAAMTMTRSAVTAPVKAEAKPAAPFSTSVRVKLPWEK